MNKGFTVVECFVVVAILVILAGMLLPAIGLVRKHNKDKEQNDKTEQFDCTADLTNNTPVSTYIITDPKSNQKWIVFSRGASVTVLPYVAPKVEKVEKE